MADELCGELPVHTVVDQTTILPDFVGFDEGILGELETGTGRHHEVTKRYTLRPLTKGKWHYPTGTA